MVPASEIKLKGTEIMKITNDNQFWSMVGGGTVAVILGLILAIGAPISKATQTPLVHCSVVLMAHELYTNGQPVDIVVYASSSSPGATPIPRGTTLSDAIAVQLTDGLHVDHIEGLVVYMTK